ncbi:MAG: tryptophan-rich sensory protein [Clostridia bacterium]|nr:tryptophan-rich sensory protein [Clostridia bacterium]
MSIKNKEINWKALIISLLISLGVGTLSAILNKDAFMAYTEFEKPFLSPPSIVFPIVWTILYFLMAISAYMIYESDHADKKIALAIYGIQLLVNFVWPFIFFGGQYFLFAFIWLLLLIVATASMIFVFYRINKKAGLLQLPYLLWLLFAAYLNFGVYLLNQA